MFIERLPLLIFILFSTGLAQFFDGMSYPELDYANSYFNDDTDPYEQDFSESDSIVEDDEDDKQGWTVVSEEEVAELAGRIEAAERHEQFAKDADHFSTVVPATTEEFVTDAAEELESEEKEEGEEIESTTTPLQTVASLFSHLFSTSPSTDDGILEESRADANEPESHNKEGMNLSSETELQKEEKVMEASTTEEEAEASKPEELIKESEGETSKFTELTMTTEKQSPKLDKETSDTETTITTSVDEVATTETEETKPTEITPESDVEFENVDGKSAEMETEPPKLEEFSSAMETKQSQIMEETEKKTESTIRHEDKSQIMTDTPYSTTRMQEIEPKTLIAEDDASSSLKAAVPSSEEKTEKNEWEASESEEVNSKSKTSSQEIVEPHKEDEPNILKSKDETEPAPEVIETENKTHLLSEKESPEISGTVEAEKEVQRSTLKLTQETTVDTEIPKSEEKNTESREPVEEASIIASKAATVNYDEPATPTQTDDENTQGPQTEEVSQEITEELRAASSESL
ncbi:unnamed protein product [Rodentolepis nana]|uniref:SEA domain-containing protein n=1 Tax=Rodentolepis nana TaxID=102285 RepID=A0A0R3T2H2_RODNA|nr:unnamed protein product [Rodentolepis nana]